MTQQPVVVVISDLNLGPEMDGFELAERVHATGANVQLILATSRADIDGMLADRIELAAVLNTPYRPEELRRLVRELTAPEVSVERAHPAA